MISLEVGVITAKLYDLEPKALKEADIVQYLSARAHSRVGKSGVTLEITIK